MREQVSALFSGLPLNWELGAIGLSVLICVVLLAVGARALLGKERDEVVERIDRMAAESTMQMGRGGRGDSRDSGEGGGLAAKLIKPFAWLVRPTKTAELSQLRGRLTQAGIRGDHAMELFLASKLLLACGATLTFLYINSRLVQRVAFPMDVGIAVWTCAAFFQLPNLWLGSRIKARQAGIERSLPDAMDLLVTCVEAGLGLDAALARVSDEIRLAAPLLAQEMNVTFMEIQAGIARRDSFRRLAERTGVEDLRQLSAVLAQTEMFGTSIAKALRIHADSMRTKRMQRAEEKAASVGVKMTIPLIMCFLPSLVAVILGPAIGAMITQLK
jgi:tight adherence protein C